MPPNRMPNRLFVQQLIDMLVPQGKITVGC
jgi:hypothetical protein